PPPAGGGRCPILRGDQPQGVARMTPVTVAHRHAPSRRFLLFSARARPRARARVNPQTVATVMTVRDGKQRLQHAASIPDCPARPDGGKRRSVRSTPPSAVFLRSVF